MWYPGFDENATLFPSRRWPMVTDPAGHPLIALLNVAAAELTQTLGPLFWAVLVILWLYAEFFSS